MQTEATTANRIANRIVIAAHLPLADALRAVAAHACPAAQHSIIAVDITADDSLDTAVRRLESHVQEQTEDTESLLFVTDLPGATPHNAVLQFVQRNSTVRQCAWVSGISVPMLLRAWNYRHLAFPAFCQAALEAATRGVLSSLPEQH